ncbi:hypothetical protein VI06_12435 [Aquitalea magnusonii]|nr:hypothetical protein VI06_12435 [Aquitalea magnusonii]
METKKYLVIQDHTTDYPEPISFAKGALLTVGERYDGPEGWEDWFFCETPGQKGGWVPAQIIEFVKDKTAISLEDYTARELNARKGEVLIGTKTINGWVWCKSNDSLESGWIPLANLQETYQ